MVLDEHLFYTTLCAEVYFRGLGLRVRVHPSISSIATHRPHSTDMRIPYMAFTPSFIRLRHHGIRPALFHLNLPSRRGSPPLTSIQTSRLPFIDFLSVSFLIHLGWWLACLGWLVLADFDDLAGLARCIETVGGGGGVGKIQIDINVFV